MFALKTVPGRRFESRHKLQTTNRLNNGFMPIFRRFSYIPSTVVIPYLDLKMQKNHTIFHRNHTDCHTKADLQWYGIDTKLKTIIMLKEFCAIVT